MIDQNVTKKEWEVIDTFKKDDTIMVLPADKGHVIVVMKKEDYSEKSNNLFKDEKAYLKLKRDPISKYKKQIGRFSTRFEGEMSYRQGVL